jgi:prepilin-type N-terminal cleavage/methylation domain-containing protein
MKRIKLEDGFTLIEMVITVIILTLIASLASLSIGAYIADAQDRTAAADVATYAAVMRTYVLDHGFPTTAGEITTFNTNVYTILYQDLKLDNVNQLPKDPWSNPAANYVVLARIPSGDTQYKIYVGSRGHDQATDYGEIGARDDIYRYIR